MMLLEKLEQLGAIRPPSWLSGRTHYLVHMGSSAFGANDEDSDFDVQGFVIPPSEQVYPCLQGDIPGFGTPRKPFREWTQQHIGADDTSYDLTVWSIVRYFDLLRDCNPAVVESLFAPAAAILHATPIADLIRRKRQMFLSKRVLNAFRGVARANQEKIVNKRVSRFVVLCRAAGVDAVEVADNPQTLSVLVMAEKLGTHAAGELVGLLREADRDGGWGRRLAIVNRYGYDVGCAYHLVRFMLECEQLLTTGDMDLRRDAAIYRAIRQGEWSLERVNRFVEDQSRRLDAAAEVSRLPEVNDHAAIHRLLLNCLEEQNGSLRMVVQRDHATVIEAIQSEPA